MILISTTEPKPFHALGQLSMKPENYGCDFLILSGTKRVGVQRKKFPEDFLGSLTDNRLYLQLQQIGSLKNAILVVEGYGQWSDEGELMWGDYQHISYQVVIAIFCTIMFEFGIPVLWVKNMRDTITVLETIEEWMGKAKHLSLKTRQGPKRDAWGKVSNKAFAMHILMGWPQVGPVMAENIIDTFGMIPLSWTHSVEEFLTVPGIGKRTAESLVKSLDLEIEGDKLNERGKK